ncbi:MAG: T9SS type A sorting domain-containing protein [Bacteriovoracaceae bacterium]|nr:T9SS type A sorting domain-containing protein [Bacteroidota bacterium]
MKNKNALITAALCAVLFIVFCLLVIPQPTPLKFSGAMQALQLWNAQRAYPGTTIDDRKYFDAFERQRFEKASEYQLTGSTDVWRQIGPHNIGGRTLAVAVNPTNTSTIYAGSASGGLWRSYSEGKGAQAWERMKTGFAVLAVSSIAIVPNDSNTMLIGTGEVYNQFSSIGGLSIRTTRGSYGIGILRTSNGGVSWEKTLDWNYGELRGVQAVKIHPAFNHMVWAATTEGIYKSVDTGKTWVNVSDIPMGTDLVFDVLDSGVVIAAHGNLGSVGGGIYRTLDGGKTWDQLTNGLPINFGGKIIFAQYAAAPQVIFASIGNGAGNGTWLCKTVNYGDTWTIVTITDYSSYQGWYSHCVGVDPGDSSKVICGGIDLWKSTNGGTSLIRKSDWSAWYFGTPLPGDPEGPPEYSHADHHAIVYDPLNYDKIYFANDGGVFCSMDGGETFEGRNGGYQTTQFYNGFSSSHLDSLLAIGGMQDNSTAIYKGSVAWTRVIGGDGCMTAMSPTSKDTMYGTYQYLTLLRSENGGVSFNYIPVPTSNFTNFIGPYALAESHPKILYAGRDVIFKSTNGGTNWNETNDGRPLNGNPALAIAIAPTSPDTAYVTTTPIFDAAEMFRTVDGGISWTNISGSLPDRYLVDIAVHPKNSAVVYVTASGFGTPHLFKTTNAGATWSNAGEGLPDVPTSAIIVSPFNSNHLYLGNDLGVYLSIDGGSTWTTFSDGFVDATLVMDLSISRTNKAIRAVTHGNGIYERKLFDGTTSVGSDRMVASEFRLEQNYPNPFNPATTIQFTMPQNSLSMGRMVGVIVEVFDVMGKKVSTLVDEQKSPGTYTVQWNASKYANGTYFVKLQSGGMVQVMKMVLLK